MSSNFSSQEFATFFNETSSKLNSFKIRETNESDPQNFKQRVENLTFQVSTINGPFLVDVSKESVSEEFLNSCINYLKKSDFESKLNEMKLGKEINYTEQRKVLHIALRDLEGSLVKDKEICQEVNEVLNQMKVFSEKLHSGEFKGFTDKKFKYCINIGIGGSDLGPKMVVEALKPFSLPHIKSFFVSNVDASHLVNIVEQVNLDETIFIICSKTFTTKETLMNADSARKIIFDHFKSEDPQIIAKHFCAISTNLEGTKKFGIEDSRVFKFWDWVGGRLSVWSSIGFAVILQIGFENFKSFLNGANLMDQHFFSEKFEKNVPLILALIKLYNLNALGHQTHAILPYDQNLEYLCPYLQQLEMESNGKTFKKDSTRASLESSSIIFGQPGTNGQHAFYQFLHQDQTKVASTFIAAAQPANIQRLTDIKQKIVKQHHLSLIANCIAQAEALAIGKSDEDVLRELKTKNTPEHLIEMLKSAKTFEGDRSSTFIAYKELTPSTLGTLVALFEHVTYCCGLLAGINSYDQFGVELGKHLALKIESDLQNSTNQAKHDHSTEQIIKFFK